MPQNLVIDFFVLHQVESESHYLETIIESLHAIPIIKHVNVHEQVATPLVYNNKKGAYTHISIYFIERYDSNIRDYLFGTSHIQDDKDYLLLYISRSKDNPIFEIYWMEKAQKGQERKHRVLIRQNECPNEEILAEHIQNIGVHILVTEGEEQFVSYQEDDHDELPFDPEIETTPFYKSSEELNLEENLTEFEVEHQFKFFETPIQRIDEETNEYDNASILPETTRHIQKKLFARQKVQHHKTIAIWSPLHRMGVTTFSINFAFYLAENGLLPAVLEALHEEFVMQYTVARYKPKPSNWRSYASLIHDTSLEPTQADWQYRNVLFLPLAPGDMSYKWSKEKIEDYVKMPKLLDITLIDLPTGEMTESTLLTINFVDELWILIDDSYHDILAWKKYIQSINERIEAGIHLVFHKEFPFSQVDRIAKEIGLSVIARFPSLHEELLKNNYETRPIYFKPDIKEKLYPGFTQLAFHLWQEEFQPLVVEKQNIISMWSKWKVRLFNRSHKD